MDKSFYDADALLDVRKAVKLKKCSECSSFLIDTKAHCKTCDMKFIVDLLEAFPRSVISSDST
jgi:hypothetical protein